MRVVLLVAMYVFSLRRQPGDQSSGRIRMFCIQLFWGLAWASDNCAERRAPSVASVCFARSVFTSG